MACVSPVSVRVMVVLSVGMTSLLRVSTAIISDVGAPGAENANVFEIAAESVLEMERWNRT